MLGGGKAGTQRGAGRVRNWEWKGGSTESTTRGWKGAQLGAGMVRNSERVGIATGSGKGAQLGAGRAET